VCFSITPGLIFWAAFRGGLGGEGREMIALLADHFPDMRRFPAKGRLAGTNASMRSPISCRSIRVATGSDQMTA
jgi:hypothetical protein